MTQQVRLEHASARTLAAISTTASPGGLGSVIIGTLDKIWPMLRGQGAAGEVRLTATPSGDAATVAHFGDYSQMDPAYAALERWCADNERDKTGVSWEVYSDWDDDPAKRRTDIFFGLKPAAQAGSRDRADDAREPA